MRTRNASVERCPQYFAREAPPGRAAVLASSQTWIVTVGKTDARVGYTVVRALAPQARHTGGVVRGEIVSPGARLEILGLNQKLRAPGGFSIALSAHAGLA